MTAFPLSRLAEGCCLNLPHGTADPAEWVLLLWALMLAVLLLAALMHWALALEVLEVSRLGGNLLLLELRQRLVLWMLALMGEVLLLPTVEDGLALLIGMGQVLLLPTVEDGLALLIGLPLVQLLPVRAARFLQRAVGSLHQAAWPKLLHLVSHLVPHLVLQKQLVLGSLSAWPELLHSVPQGQLLLGSLRVHRPS